ncbi:MAG: TonB-dependent receptor [Ignavibacteriales bacterium]|nr:TonB-dependent receptor [Ignavibacteriales bacterium]
MKIKKLYYLVFKYCLPILSIVSVNMYAQTSGKISGRVTDNLGEPLVFATIIVEGTKQGAASDVDGYYAILNIRAGIYTVSFRSIGFQTKVVQNVRINPDQTTKLDAVLGSQVVMGEQVTVIAQRPLIEINQTSSISTIGKEELEKLPVQGLNEIVNLQAGVVDGHFRGGRIGEVQYQVDGVTVNNPYNNSSTLELDRSVLQEVQVISGTFDAKYGQAMSGVVNAVLKTGSDKFEWSGEVFGGDHYTTDSQRYPDNKDLNPSSVQNYQLTLSGPTYLPQTTFFISGRRYINNGYLYGYRLFNPTDKNDLENKIFNPTGDKKRVAMGTNQEWSGQFKITNQALNNIQVSYQAGLNKLKRTNYDYGYRLNPDGTKPNYTTSLTHGIQFIHTLSEKMFYKLDARQNYFDYKDMKYDDVYDPRYLTAGSPKGDANYEEGAIVQGVDLGRFIQKTNSAIFKGDFTWQVDRSNMLEAGLESQISEMSFGQPGFLVPVFVNDKEILQPFVPIEGLLNVQSVKTYFPKQVAAYLQDRLEWGDLVVRAGFRFEYFDAHSQVPSDLQNPANSISGVPLSYAKSTTVKYAFAPRLGFSFPLTNSASIYFSYGHFYQMPGLGNLYSNADYSILKDLAAGGITYGVMGNPDLNPEKTVQYECGLKQTITNSLGLELSFFYKDIRDLLGVEFIGTYAAAEYPRFTNVDFGSATGFTISLTQRSLGQLSTTIDYTMQFAQGNSSDPRESANRAAGGKDSRPRDIPFGWDQRHTLNATAIWYEPDDYSISAIVKFGSGQPYTPEIGLGFGADLETNSGRKDSYVLVDLRAEKFFSLGFINLSVFARMFNLLNTHFVNGFVFNTTGSPDYSINPGDRTTLTNPSRFQEPRRIEIGISFRSN